MKKLIALMLTTMLLLSLCACGKAKTDDETLHVGSLAASIEKDTGDGAENAAKKAAVNAAGKGAKKDVGRSAGDESEDEFDAETEEPQPTGEPVNDNVPAYALADTLVVKDDNCAFTITGVKQNTECFILTGICENYTNINLKFRMYKVSINGYMISPDFSEIVAPGAQADTEILFYLSSLETYGITTVEEIDFTLLVRDSDDKEADYLVEKEGVVYPTGLSADMISPYAERQPQPGDVVLLDNEDFTFVIVGSAMNSEWGFLIGYYIVNKTDKTVVAILSAPITINGKTVETDFQAWLAPGKRSFEIDSFSPQTLLDSQIISVQELTFMLLMLDAGDINNPQVMVYEACTYKP